MRSMGQSYLNPPNVRGWVGGKHWINSATLIQRRQIVEGLFSTSTRRKLNGDEERALEKAKASGRNQFFVTQDRSEAWASLLPKERIAHFANSWLVNPLEPKIEKSMIQFLNKNKNNPLPATRSVAITLLQSPEYQLA